MQAIRDLDAELDRQNPGILTPPRTDNGSIPNLKFSFGNAHNRLEVGGWAGEVTVRDLPAATGLAGVDMRLGPGVVREMHWHKEAVWGYVLDALPQTEQTIRGNSQCLHG